MSESSMENSVNEAESLDRNDRKTRQGYVVSDKMDKTVVVEVQDRVKHPLQVLQQPRRATAPRRQPCRNIRTGACA